ncbi:baeRF7 domain-containing protein [Stratiformator vulcanicus]|uniref:baeRF7 domain-containing protein n=1 Tax=Stratiformator vulcanicus TaxID=2527980 RepID=UPI0011A8E6BE|nr:hypothetical protein [Stratiformator vulcanicus]
MDRFTRKELDKLLAYRGDVVLTITMPTHRTGGPELREDRIRFKNLLNEAQGQLEEFNADESVQKTTLRPLVELQDDENFWEHQGDGLVAFVGVKSGEADLFATYRMPVEFESRCVVDHRPDVAPLVQVVQGDGRYFVLAVSPNRVRLFEGSRFGLTEIEHAAMPENLVEALRIDEYKEHLQFHSVGADSSGGDAIYHGQGGSDLDRRKATELTSYFRRIDDALAEALGTGEAPLVFAGVEYLYPIFKEATRYSALLDEPVAGNPDDLSAQDLFEKAWPLVHQQYRTGLDEKLERLSKAVTTDLGETDPDKVFASSLDGAVETLYVSKKAWISGQADDSNRVLIRTGEAGEAGTSSSRGEHRNAIEDIVNRVLQYGGTVYYVEPEDLPESSELAAQYRYPVAEQVASS